MQPRNSNNVVGTQRAMRTFASLLERAQAGERIRLMRYRVEVAAIVGIEDLERLEEAPLPASSSGDTR